MDLIARFHELMALVPELLQPLVVALAGAVPFIEGEGAASIGILGGLHPVVAVLAGAAGNFLCVTVLVLVSARARSAIVTRSRVRSSERSSARDAALASASASGRSTVSGSVSGAGSGAVSGADSVSPSIRESADDEHLEPAPGSADSPRKAARRAKFQRALDRYGVPGVSLLGPLLLPTQFTATMLAAGGVRAGRVLFWQGLAILAWSTLLGVVVGGVVHVVG